MSAGVRKGMSKLKESARACSAETMVGWRPLATLNRPGCWDPTLLVWLCCRNLGPRNCCWKPWEVRWALTEERRARRRRGKWNRPIAIGWAADTEVEMVPPCICHLPHNGMAMLLYSSLHSAHYNLALLRASYMHPLQHTPLESCPGDQKSNPGFSFLKSSNSCPFLCSSVDDFYPHHRSISGRSYQWICIVTMLCFHWFQEISGTLPVPCHGALNLFTSKLNRWTVRGVSSAASVCVHNQIYDDNWCHIQHTLQSRDRQHFGK